MMMSAIDPETNEASAGRAAHAGAPSYVPYQVASVPPLREPRMKSPVLAAILSLMPGLGQVYVGYYPRGFVHISVVAGIVSILAASQDEAYIPLLGMFLAFFWLYNVIDAARLAVLYNQVVGGGREPELPDGFKLPGMGGSILGGAILMAAGFAVLLHTRWGMRLDWIAEWWPVFPMLFGAYLVGKAIVERGQARPGA
jgi:hypothetical protein